MQMVQNISDISKETLTFLAFFDKKMIEKIPANIIKRLCDEAADSNLDFYIDASRTFEEQEISEKSKDLISLIYYYCIAEEDEQKEILKQWNLNETNYQNDQKEKYNYDNLFKQKENITHVELIKVEKETIFQKIKKLLKKLLNK